MTKASHVVERPKRVKFIQDKIGEFNQVQTKEIANSLLEDETEKLTRQIREMDEAVFTAGKINRIAKMAELWYKRKGLLLDKVEVKIGRTADELARTNSEAERELREFRKRLGQGMD